MYICIYIYIYIYSCIINYINVHALMFRCYNDFQYDLRHCYIKYP